MGAASGERSTATARIGASPSVRLGALPLGMVSSRSEKRRRRTVVKESWVSFSERVVSFTWSGCRSASARWAAVGYRQAGCTSRQRRMISWSQGGQSGRRRRGGTGSRQRRRLSPESRWGSPKGRTPVTKK